MLLTSKIAKDFPNITIYTNNSLAIIWLFLFFASNRNIVGHLVYTAGHNLTNRDKRALKIPIFISSLKKFNVKSVIDLRFMEKPLQGIYSVDNLKMEFEKNNITYLSRVEEVYLFNKIAKTTDDVKERSQLFKSHLYTPIINYINAINHSNIPTVLLFNYWEVYNLIPTSGGYKYQANVKGTFSKYVKSAKIDMDLYHIWPQKGKIESKAYTNAQLFDESKGELLNIDYYLNRSIDDEQGYSESNEDLWQEISDWELKGMNEESGGAAHWNID